MAKKKTALITGLTGQDGSYLAELLLEKDYRVLGLWRRGSEAHLKNVSHLLDRIELVGGDLLESLSLTDAIRRYQPDELYNLASQSFPGESWRLPVQTAEVNALGAHLLFEAVRQVKPDCRIYQASSSEMFGKVKETPQNENTPFDPVNPYAAAKLYAHNIARIYRNSFGLFISCGILFNHESPRRGFHFLTQKVTYGAACISLGINNSPILNEQGEPIVKNGRLAIGNLDVQRDWGFAGDYVRAMWLMLQHGEAEDFVIGTGSAHTVRQLCELAFSHVGLNWQDHVVVDPRFLRPLETGATIADPGKAERILGWKPEVSFSRMIASMVDAHLSALGKFVV